MEADGIDGTHSANGQLELAEGEQDDFPVMRQH